MKHGTQGIEIAEGLAIPCFSKGTQADAKEVAQMFTGYIHGSKGRVALMGVMITRP